MSVFMNMRGTIQTLATSLHWPVGDLVCPCEVEQVECVDLLRISVRTEDTKLINRAFTLASSR
jgi:hypothetical protein